MCLILFAYKSHPRYRLVLLANRDEFYDRATAPLQFWQDHPDVLAGRDLEKEGTWLGITRGGRLAAITNYRDPLSIKADAPSRGHLVADFLLGRETPAHYMHRVRLRANQYNGFNLIVGDTTGLFYFSNRDPDIRSLAPGIYGLSNHLLDTPWPKVREGKNRLATMLQSPTEPTSELFFDLLQHREIPPDDHLPHTGVDFAWERVLSPIFITSPTYGTRSSSVLLIDTKGRLRLWERTWTQAQPEPRADGTQYYELIVPGTRDGRSEAGRSNDLREPQAKQK